MDLKTTYKIGLLIHRNKYLVLRRFIPPYRYGFLSKLKLLYH